MGVFILGGIVKFILDDLLIKFIEKMELIYECLEVVMVVFYIYMGNKVGVIVGLLLVSDVVYEVGCDVVMQVVVMKLVVVDQDGVDQIIIEKEIEIGMEVVCKEGKLEVMLEKIVKGKFNKFFKENILLN